MANRTDAEDRGSPRHANERPKRFKLTRRPLRLSVMLGALVAAVILGVGVLVLIGQGTTWSASASVLVLPSKELDPETQAGYYETLSRGQVVSTFAEMLRLRRFETAAADKLGLSTAERRQVKVTIEVVPDTAVITIRARATDPGLTEQMVDHMLGAWDLEVWDLSTPYVPSILSWASGTARKSGTEPFQLGAALVVVALFTGLAVQQGTLQLATLLARRRVEDEVETATPPPPPSEPAAPSELNELDAALFERWWKAPGLFGSTGRETELRTPSGQVAGRDDESSEEPDPRDDEEAVPETHTA